MRVPMRSTGAEQPVVCAVSKSGGNASLARVEVSAVEDRVSIVRWNPKGLRRNTGP